MGLFTPYQGKYEVTYKANTIPMLNNVKEQKIVVDAKDLSDARTQAEKQLKSNGYKFVNIISARKL